MNENLARRETKKNWRQNFVLSAIFSCMVTALSIYSALLQLIEYKVEPLILQWYKAQIPPGPQRCLLQFFKRADPSTRKIIVQTNLLRSKRSVLWQCDSRITAAVAEVAGTAMTDWNSALFMKFWKNPEAFIRGANLKFAAKKGWSTAKPGKNTAAKSDIISMNAWTRLTVTRVWRLACTSGHS